MPELLQLEDLDWSHTPHPPSSRRDTGATSGQPLASIHGGAMDVSEGQPRTRSIPMCQWSAQAWNGRTKCMVKPQPRNGTAQTFRDLHRRMNHPCTHTSTTCAGSLGDARCTRLSRAGDCPGRNKQPIVSAQATPSSQDMAYTQTQGCFSLHKLWSCFTHSRPTSRRCYPTGEACRPAAPFPPRWAHKATPPELTFSR